MPNNQNVSSKWFFRKIYRTVIPSAFRRWIHSVRKGVHNHFFPMEITYKSFGDFMPEKTFYIIRRSQPAGLFSNFHYVLSHVICAIEHNYIPVVDMQNHLTDFNEKKAIDGTCNAWEYYFKQPMGYTLDDAYRGKNVILSANEYFENLVPYACFDAEMIKKLHRVICTYLQFNDKTVATLKDAEKKLFAGRTNILGVQYRGTDYKTAVGHSKTPDLDVIIEKAKFLLKDWGMEYIYLTTEDSAAVNKFRKSFGELLITTDSKRVDNYNNHMGEISKIGFNRKNDNYLKGLEYIIDIYLLSKCDSIICPKVNGAMAAFELNNNKYKNKYIFELGVTT